jgi:hypothetical protein
LRESGHILGDAPEGGDTGAVGDHGDGSVLGDVEGGGDGLHTDVFGKGLEVVGAETILEEGDHQIDVPALGVPGTERVDTHVVQAHVRQEGQVRLQLVQQLLGRYLDLFLVLKALDQLLLLLLVVRKDQSQFQLLVSGLLL